MPSQKILQQKQAAVAELVKLLNDTGSGVLVSYTGITVEEDTKLRAELRKNGVKYSVVKNTLLEFAVKEVGLGDLASCLAGSTALAVNTESPTAAAKVLCQFASKNDKFQVKAGFIDGEALDVKQVEELAKIPSKEMLISRLMGSLNAPITGLAIALKAIADKKAEEAA